jgi:protein TonB
MVFAPSPVLPTEREALPPARLEDAPAVDVTAEAAETASKDTVELPLVVPAPMAAQAIPSADAAPVLTGRAPDAGLCQLVCAAPRRPRAASGAASSAVVGSTVVPALTTSSTGSAVAASSGGPVLAHAGVQVLERVSPVYPRQARRQGLEGVVCLDVTVDDHGHVVAVAVATTSGHTVLDAAAREAVRRWRFTPAEGDAEQVRITIRFQLT